MECQRSGACRNRNSSRDLHLQDHIITKSTFKSDRKTQCSEVSKSALFWMTNSDSFVVLDMFRKTFLKLQRMTFSLHYPESELRSLKSGYSNYHQKYIGFTTLKYSLTQ